MKILIFSPVADSGGVSQYILSLIKNVNVKDTKFMFTSLVPGELIDELHIYGVRTIALLSSVKNKGILFAAIKLRNLVQREKIEVVHAHTARAGFITSIALIGLSTKFVYTGHGWRFEQVKGLSRSIQMIAAKIICWRAKVVVALSKFEYNIAVHKHICNKNKIKIIKTQIPKINYRPDVRLQDVPVPNGVFVIGFVASFVKEKDPLFFAETCAVLAKKIPNTHFIWVGGGPMEKDFVQKIKTLNLSEKFTITGAVKHSDISVHLSKMDVFFMSSSVEVFPISLLEAMAIGRICVAPDVGAVSEIIHHNVTGFLYSERKPDIVASLILNSLGTSVGFNAERHIKDHYANLVEFADDYMKIYQI